HLVVVRDDRLDLAPSIVDAFERAKAAAVEAGELDAAGGDPFPYGLEPNRAVLEELIDHAAAQKILCRRPSLDELFIALP
ncbi:MAG TPA: hypothetical protein VIU44_00435, partial [Gaiellaceae bacterium]